MSKKRTLSIGDCFELKLNNLAFVYLQYIRRDEPMLNSDCIRFFNFIGKTPLKGVNFLDAYTSDTWFYGHTYIEKSERMGLYKFVGNFPTPPDEIVNQVMFCSDADLDFPLRIRKIGQEINDSVVTPQEYLKLKPQTWRDSVMGPMAFAERIELKIANPDYEYLY